MDSDLIKLAGGCDKMSQINRVIRLLKRPHSIVKALGTRGLLNWMPDKIYLKLIYRAEVGGKLNLNSPSTYTEKLQWLKIYDRNPKYIEYVDKFKVRSIISDSIGGQHLIPLIGVYNSVEEIDWAKLPNQFVLKCTHGSHCNIICKDKGELDIELAKSKLNKWMKKSWYWFGREWVYKEIKPRIVCEQFMVDNSNEGLKDYKFLCFNGKAKSIFIAQGLGKNRKSDFYDLNFQHIPVKQHNENSDSISERPINLKKMIELSEVLSKDIPHVRVDFYEINGKVYFGELTFYHFSGLRKFEPDSYDKLLGKWLKLPEKVTF